MAGMVTGGAGSIGSQAVQRLLRDGHDVVAFDHFYRGHREPMVRLASQSHPGRLTFVAGDIADRSLVERLLRDHRVDTIMHFAALT